MTQFGFLNQNGTVTVIMVIIVHSWNYDTNRREGVSHFMITDDLKKPICRSTSSWKMSLSSTTIEFENKLIDICECSVSFQTIVDINSSPGVKPIFPYCSSSLLNLCHTVLNVSCITSLRRSMERDWLILNQVTKHLQSVFFTPPP